MSVAIDISTGLAFDGDLAEALNGEMHNLNALLAQRRQLRRTLQVDGGAGKVLRLDSHPRFRENVRFFEAFARRSIRNDDISTNLGTATARQLEHVFAEVQKEVMAPTNALALFIRDTSVKPGVRKFTFARQYGQGSAAVHRGGRNVPMVSVGIEEESGNVRHYVNGFVLDIFDELSLGRVNLSGAAELLRQARVALDEFANLATWYGLPDHGVWGVLDYPWLSKYIESQAFNDSQSTTAMVRALHRIANYVSDTMKGAARPDTMVMGNVLYNYLSTKQMSVDNDKSVLATFMANNKYIKRVEPAWELDGVGPANYDGILVYRNDRLSMSNVIVQPFSALPQQREGFDRRTYCYMSHGGSLQRQVHNNLLAWVAGPNL